MSDINQQQAMLRVAALVAMIGDYAPTGERDFWVESLVNAISDTDIPWDEVVMQLVQIVYFGVCHGDWIWNDVKYRSIMMQQPEPAQAAARFN